MFRYRQISLFVKWKRKPRIGGTVLSSYKIGKIYMCMCVYGIYTLLQRKFHL